MDKKMQQARERYQQIKAPEILEERLQNIIEENSTVRRSGNIAAKYAVSIAAACILCVTAALNISPSFAAAAAEMPLLGQLAQVLTVREYSHEDNTALINAEIPNVSQLNDADFQAYINEQINERTSAILSAAEADAKEREEAFIATGGEANDFMPVIIDINYEIFCQTPEVLSFVVNCTETQANAFTTQYFYNLDLRNNTVITLEDMLGPDYIAICNQQVKEQIAAREAADPDNRYFHDEGAFESITPEQNFYINQDGNVVLSFEKYTVAPGYMGIQTFEINK